MWIIQCEGLLDQQIKELVENLPCERCKESMKEHIDFIKGKPICVDGSNAICEVITLE